MILPERVFGNSGVNWITSGGATRPISCLTYLTKDFLISSKV